MEIAGLTEFEAINPAAARKLQALVKRLATRVDASEWATSQLPALLAAGTRSSILDIVVKRASAEVGAGDAWALLWSGDLAGGNSSFQVFAGQPGNVPAPSAISTTLVAQVARSGTAVWTEDARADERFAAAQSIVARDTGAVACVPLVPESGDAREASGGALYLDRPATGRFSGQSRARVEALCALAGVLLQGGDRKATPAVEPIRGLVGVSRPMQELFAAIRAFSPMPWPALVLGETGTGKEAVARALHDLSPRRSGPFVAINCAAVPDDLAESTFFGHERGAFTGADKRREGLLERADGGTLFLDEVGELSPRVQAKLLRVLQEGTYQRLGGEGDLRFRGRIVAATLRPLDADGSKSVFRTDLYHRLSACVLRVPALSQRRDDVPMLAKALLSRALAQLPGAPGITLSNEAAALLARRDWPGNVRELENAIRTAVALAVAWGDDRIVPSHFNLPDPDLGEPEATPRSTSGGTASGEGLLQATDNFQRQMVKQALESTGGNRQDAAARLGVTRQWLHRLLARWGGIP